jgi:glutamyl-tRNA reductase
MTKDRLSFFCWGVSHQTAPIEFREKISPDAKQLTEIYQVLGQKEWMSELTILSTCNRFEIYGAAYETNSSIIASSLSTILGVDSSQLSDKSNLIEGEHALQHLFAVTSGLDSQIVGEVEITGQVKQAFLHAAKQRTVGRLLNRAFQKSFQTTKWIRSNTNIGKGQINVATVAVDLALKVFGNLKDSSTVVIGAGDIAEKIIAALRSRGVNRLVLSNRTFEKAQKLASQTGGLAAPMEELDQHLIRADVVLCSTSSQDLILTEKRMQGFLKKRGIRPLCLIDLALPRDIDPALEKSNNVFLYNLDDLAELAEFNLKARKEELGKCHAYIAKKIQLLAFGRSSEPPQGSDQSEVQQT